MRIQPCIVLLLAFSNSTAFAQESVSKVFSMDAIRKLSDVFKDAKNEKVDRSRMLTLYEALLILQQNTGREFLDALAAYVSSAERTAPILERDFRLNKVGEKSVAVVAGLRTVEQALNHIRSTLTLNDGDFITHLLAFAQSRDLLTGGQILREHRLVDVGLPGLREILNRARSNAALLDKVVEEMGAIICQRYPDACGAKLKG